MNHDEALPVITSHHLSSLLSFGSPACRQETTEASKVPSAAGHGLPAIVDELIESSSGCWWNRLRIILRISLVGHDIGIDIVHELGTIKLVDKKK